MNEFMGAAEKTPRRIGRHGSTPLPMWHTYSSLTERFQRCRSVGSSAGRGRLRTHGRRLIARSASRVRTQSEHSPVRNDPAVSLQSSETSGQQGVMSFSRTGARRAERRNSPCRLLRSWVAQDRRRRPGINRLVTDHRGRRFRHPQGGRPCDAPGPTPNRRRHDRR